MSELETRIQYSFKDPTLLKLALTHKSYAYQFKPHLECNEVLEFLGDAVLDLVMSEYLIEVYPGDEEGSLSKKRASLVNEVTLADIARQIGIQENLLLGKGEMMTGGISKQRILASAYEALVGALFQDGGYSEVREHVRLFFKNLVASRSAEEFHSDFKSRLQEHVQTEVHETPIYEQVAMSGPAHDRQFVIAVRIRGLLVAEGQGKSKKLAEQDAARNALEKYASLLQRPEFAKTDLKNNSKEEQ